MPRPKKIKPVIASESLYKATLKANGKEYQGEAETLVEAIRLITPEHYKTR